MVASIFKEGKRVLNLRDYQYFVCLFVKIYNQLVSAQKMRIMDIVSLLNRISKMQTFTDLYNYLTSSAVFYILPIQNKWLKCKKWHKCESVPLRIHYLFEYPETPAFKAGTT